MGRLNTSSIAVKTPLLKEKEDSDIFYRERRELEMHAISAETTMCVCDSVGAC